MKSIVPEGFRLVIKVLYKNRIASRLPVVDIIAHDLPLFRFNGEGRSFGGGHYVGNTLGHARSSHIVIERSRQWRLAYYWRPG